MTLEDLIRDMIRQSVRDEIWPLREEMKIIAAEVARTRALDGARGDFLTVEEVAGFLKVTEPTVRGWIKSGALPAAKPAGGNGRGRVYRIARAHLDEFVAATAQATEPDVDVKAEAARIVALSARGEKP